jgi:hypothetical protein
MIMGDRANFGFQQSNGDVLYLYGHWAGHQMMGQLATALEAVKGEGREKDEAYANRIAISQIIGENWKNPLGWGITVNTLADNEHTVPVVDWANDTVKLFDHDWKTSTLADLPKVTFTLEGFINKFSLATV